MISADDSRIDASVVSGKTGQHVSIRLAPRANDGSVWVNVPLKYATVVFANRPGKGRADSRIGKYSPRRSAWDWDDSATIAEKWAADTLLKYAHTGIMPTVCNIVEAVECSRCGELLYDPESITKGIGPTCNRKRTKSKAARSGAADRPSTEDMAGEAEIMRAEMRANGIPGY